MELREFSQTLRQEDRLNFLECRLQELDQELKFVEERLTEEIMPNEIYDVFNASVRFRYKERAKTFVVTNHFDETYVVKKSELEKGDVRRLNLHIELGRVRKARLDEEGSSLTHEIEEVQNSIMEFHFNEFLYGVACDSRTIEVYERLNQNRQLVVETDSYPTCVNWLKDGF